MMRRGYLTALAQASRWGRLLPIARRAFTSVEVLKNLSYTTSSGSSEQVMDVYRPRQLSGPAPVVLYIHGGAFTDLSKDTHWMMGLAFAHAGYIVCNINYRLAPKHPFPAAIEDALAAALWVHENIAKYGGDPKRVVVAGESAGGNLATSVTLAAAHRFELPAAQRLFDAGLSPAACIAACGILQVTETERFSARRKRPLPTWVHDQLTAITRAYLPESARRPEWMSLADPLVFLEQGEPTTHELPPFFTFAGTRDPILDDTRRLAEALSQRGVACTSKVYPGELHAFHAVIPRAAAQTCWQDQFAFLATVLGLTDTSPMLGEIIRAS
ncbi:MAG: alpha/beta hydrolase [Nannocystaceae bacterium]